MPSLRLSKLCPKGWRRTSSGPSHAPSLSGSVGLSRGPSSGPSFGPSFGLIPRLLLALLLVLAIGAGSVFLWRALQPAAAPEQVAVTRGDIENVIKAVGSVHPCREVEVGTLANGQLRSVKVKLGDQVKKGQLLAEIDPEIPENEVRTRRAFRDEADARQSGAVTMLAFWDRKRQRASLLHDQGAGSLADAEQAEAEWRRHRALVQEHRAALVRAQSELGTAEKRLSDTRIVAPIDGQVLSFKILEGQTVVAAQTAQVIMVLADMARITVFAQVSEADISRVRSGQIAYFSTLAEPGRRIDSTIRDVEPNATLRANDTSRAIYYNAVLDTDNQSGSLRAHMTADVTIVERGVRDVLKVPLSAVLQMPDRNGSADAHVPAYIFMQDDGPLRAVAVSLGARDDTHVSVLSGASEGDPVVLDVKTLPFGDGDPRLLGLLDDADTRPPHAADAAEVRAAAGAVPVAQAAQQAQEVFLASAPDTAIR